MSDIVTSKAVAEAPPEQAPTVAVEDDSDPDIDELDGLHKPLRHDLTDNTQMYSTSSLRTRRPYRKRQRPPYHKPLAPADPPSPKCPLGNFPLNLKMNSWLD